jgi:hypothetical protein
MICFGCSAKIPYSEIYKKRRMAAISQCSRFLWMFRCNKCNKTFNYLSFQKHKELFKKTLIDINGDAEKAARWQALCDAKEAAKLQALRDAEEAARLQALHACRSFSSNVGQCSELKTVSVIYNNNIIF